MRVWLFLVLAFLFFGVTTSLASDYLHVIGNRVYDENNTEVQLTGVNWFGFETTDFVLNGLWARNMNSMFDQIASLGFNVVRVPLSSEFIKKVRTGQTVMPGKSKINKTLNPDLVNKTSIAILDQAIAYCRTIGLKVILDMHRTPASGMIDLWYNSTYTEEDWMQNWEWLANRYKGNDAVIGADLFNEPHGVARWDGSNSPTDWHRASQTCGNRVLAVEPNWLIFVEGVETPDAVDYSWWGGNLKGVNNYPVNLNRPEKLVYSPHEYGPAIYNQWWFHNGGFDYQSLYNDHWNPQWLFINDRADVHPILIGEWGGKEYDLTSASGRWFNYLVQLIVNKRLNHTFWCWNPNSGDTGGVLNADWTTVDWGKYNVLKATLFGHGLSHTVGLGGGAPWSGFGDPGPKVMASTDEGKGFEAKNVLDANLSTRWSSTFSDNQWIYIDYRSPRTFNQVKLTWEAAYGRAYDIQISNDGVTWTTIVSQTNGDGGVDLYDVGLRSARFARMFGIQRATSYGYSLYEFQTSTIYPVITESSVESPDKSGAKAFDGDLATRWASQWSDPQWIQIDYGTPTKFNQATINWEAAYAKSYKIQVSNDAATWTDVFYTSTGDGGQDVITLPLTTSRYVRLYGFERGSGYGYSVWEMKIENTTNYALGKPSSASSVQGAGTESDKAFDGDGGTRWSSTWNDSQWIQVDLGAPQSINRVILNWEYAYGQIYLIQTSNDGTAWSTAVAVSNGDGGIDDVSFPSVSARFIRMFGLVRGTPYGFSLWEFQVQ